MKPSSRSGEPVERREAAITLPAWYEALDAVLNTDTPTTAKLLLVALIVRAGLKPDGMAYPSLQTLARQIGIGERDEKDKPREVRQVRRLLRLLETRGLTDSNERSGMTTAYRIRWEQLLHPGHQCPGSDSPSTSNHGHPCPLTPDADDRPGRTPASAVPGHPCPPNLPLNISQEPSPSNSDKWREVEGELEKEGVAKATEAVTVARERGYTPERALQIIQHYRDNAGAWKSGALFHRLIKVGPNIPIEQGWAKPDAKFVRQQEAAKETKQRTAELAAEAERNRLAKATRDQQDAELQQLEDAFGAECDRLTADDLRQMATQDSSLARCLEFRHRGKHAGLDAKRDPFIRPLLLKLLAQRVPSVDRAEPVTAEDDSPRLMRDGEARSPPASTAPTETDTPRQ